MSLGYETIQCIFCNNERLESEEHVFPSAIGGSLTIRQVCSECNSFLGSKVDSFLCDHFLIQSRRYFLGLEGKSGKVPDFFKIMGPGTLASDPSHRIKASTNPDTRKMEIRKLFHSEDLISDDGGKKVRKISIDSRDSDQIPKIIQRERKRAGLEPYSQEELEKVVSSTLKNISSVQNPEVRFQIQMDLKDFRRCLFKIAYELAFYWLGYDYISDPMAIRIRDVILGHESEESAKLRGTITIGPDFDPVKFWAEEKNSHIAYSSILRSDLLIVLKIFDIFSAVIVVSEENSRYIRNPFEQEKIRFLKLDPVLGGKTESSFHEESARLMETTFGIKRRPDPHY